MASKYEIVRVLGVGGMGTVFLARHLELGGFFALKFLAAEALANPQAVGRFRREAQATVKLKNDHVVRVFDVGTHVDGLPYMVMEYLEGEDLAGLIRRFGPLPIELATDLLMQACLALSEAHARGIVHRDLKPSNLFCVPRADGARFTLKILDFGISKLLTPERSGDEPILTGTGHFIGSVGYMSPEQMKRPKDVDARTDVWSLGVVLYEALTGRLPFSADSYLDICLKIYSEAPALPSTYRHDLPPELEAVILRCLEKSPNARYPSVVALGEALSPFGPAPAGVVVERITSEAPAFIESPPVETPRALEQAGPGPQGRTLTATGIAPQSHTIQATPRAWRPSKRAALTAGAGLALVALLGIVWSLTRADPITVDVATSSAALESGSAREFPLHGEPPRPADSVAHPASDAEQISVVPLPPELGEEAFTAPTSPAPTSPAPTFRKRARPASSARVSPPTSAHPRMNVLRKAIERDPRSSVWDR